LGLGAWELGGDALGLLQNWVEILCLDEFVGLQATLHQRTLGFLYGPLVGGCAPTTRPTSDPSPVLAAKIRFGENRRLRDMNQVTQQVFGLRGPSVARRTRKWSRGRNGRQ
jgi:hypothetical protein